jgi:ssDNA-binding replication factor A large subunit
MFSVKGEPLAQAHIRNESVERLVRLPDELTGFLEVEDRRKDMSKMGGAESAISDLRYGLSGVSFKAHVIKKSEVRAVTSKDGNPLLVCSVTLSDGTGAIPLTIWNNQINTIREGDLVQVQNAKVGSFRGEIQLSLSRKTGVLSVLVPANKELAEAPTISSVPSSFSSPSSP